MTGNNSALRVLENNRKESFRHYQRALDAERGSLE